MTDLDPQLVSQLVSEGVDLERMVQFLNDLNAGKFEVPETGKAKTVPDLSHPSVFDRSKPAFLRMEAEQARARFAELGLPLSTGSPDMGTSDGGDMLLDEEALEKIGILLYPKTAYGLLNGGCATSYADLKKNKALNAAFFEEYRHVFSDLAKECLHTPKGLTPAYINSDGSSGYSFLLLKLRMILEHKKKYFDLTGSLPDTILPAFQITSFKTDAAIRKAFGEYILTEELKVLADSIGCPTIEMFTVSQSMMAAITHSSEGLPRRIFDRAYGKAHTGISLPGGHGQNFENLAPIYRKMYAEGIRYVWLGNIDNIGYTIDPVSLALFALSGREAAFETSIRTPVDVKGGILVCDEEGRFFCGEIGAAISRDDIHSLEAEGKPVLFNCGTGLFDLEKLIPHLGEIPSSLPFRITDQDKDAGLYAQAEQITWEIIGLLEDPLFFAVEKERRFIAAKMLLETIMASRGDDAHAGSVLGGLAASLHRGLSSLLREEYGLLEKDGRWVLPS